MNYLMNSSIITNVGVFELTPLTTAEARKLTKAGEWLSSIGHQSTASAMSAVLETKVEMNRIQIHFEIKDTAIVFKPTGRLPEGVVLNLEELEEVGWELFLLKRLK